MTTNNDDELTKEEKIDKLHHEKIGDCTKCRLCEERTRIVYGEGNANADLMIVGEAPGAKEDEQGRPFVGKSGQLLDAILEKAGLKRQDVFITNTVKCRPPGNRTPKQDELDACAMNLRGQVYFVEPRVILTVGKCATQSLSGREDPLYKLMDASPLHYDKEDVPVVPIYHPAYMMRQSSEDMKKIARSSVDVIQKSIEGELDSIHSN
jgi:DNA polymerase